MTAQEIKITELVNEKYSETVANRERLGNVIAEAITTAIPDPPTREAFLRAIRLLIDVTHQQGELLALRHVFKEHGKVPAGMFGAVQDAPQISPKRFLSSLLLPDSLIGDS